MDPAGIQHPYSFGDPVALGDVLADAGFRDVSVVRRTKEARFESPKAFVEALAAAGPSARHALEQLVVQDRLHGRTRHPAGGGRPVDGGNGIALILVIAAPTSRNWHEPLGGGDRLVQVWVAVNGACLW